MNTIMASLLLVAGVFTGWWSAAHAQSQTSELVPLAYTNTLHYTRWMRPVGVTGGADKSRVTNVTRYAVSATNLSHVHQFNLLSAGIELEFTNALAAVTHCVTWGRKGAPLFVLKTCEVMPRPALSDEWQLHDWHIIYKPTTWVESVKP